MAVTISSIFVVFPISHIMVVILPLPICPWATHSSSEEKKGKSPNEASGLYFII